MNTSLKFSTLRKAAILIILVGCLLPLSSQAALSNIAVYSNSLDAAWSDWSWNTAVNQATTSPVHSPSNSLSVKYNAAWAGFYLHTYIAVDTGLYDKLSFWVHGGTTGNQKIRIVANGDGNNTYAVTALAGAWTQVVVPLSALGNPVSVTDLYWQDSSGVVQAVYYLDDIEFLPRTDLPPSGDGPALNVDVSAQRHAISEDIYGMNFPDESLAKELRLPVARWGGNATSRYNWQTSMTNTASDWFFENLQLGTVVPANLPNGSATDQFVEQNIRTGTKSLVTVPIMSWTTKSSSPRNHPFDCGFEVTKYGAQQSTDYWDSNCGNGLHTDGSFVLGNNPLDTSTPIDPSFVTTWISHFNFNYGPAGNGGVAYYNLDNEPMLWNSTHRDIHPDPVNYDEIGMLTYQYAAAIKATDPAAKTLGPALWGWCAYLYSAKDGCSPGADYAAHGNKLFVPWYLEQMKLYEQAHGVRILDYLDLHFYPQASGVTLSTAGGTATQALRLRATRSLWDSTYIDESWISDTQPGGVVVQMIPRMRNWIANYYPGTKLALTEYNWGGLESLNGALAQADVLGIFGREALDLATLWEPPTPAQPVAHAFRIFRNYDGLARGFGNVSVQATSGDQGKLSVYAAQRSTDNTLTLVVINKTATDLTSALNIAGLTLPSSAAVYRYSAGNLNAIVKLPDQLVSATGFSTLYPGNSITVFEVLSVNATNTLTINKSGTGSGTVTPSTGVISWSSSTLGTYNFTAPVTLTATANTGSSFISWTGCEISLNSACTMTTLANKSVTAQFTLNKYLLTAKAAGTGTATVVSSTGGINYSYPTKNTASELLDYGSPVTLTATGTNGSVVAWSGACDTITSSTCAISTMDAAKTVTLTATACNFSITPTSKSFTKTGGRGSIAVTATSSNCNWTATSNVSWVTLPSSYTGSKTVTYTVAKNSTGVNRSATLTVAGKTFTVSQTK